jgi:DNA-nicking Smr family endonuclease
LVNKISRISEADLKDGGEGALYVFLKQAKWL